MQKIKTKLRGVQVIMTYLHTIGLKQMPLRSLKCLELRAQGEFWVNKIPNERKFIDI